VYTFYNKVIEKINYYEENLNPEEKPSDFDLSLKEVKEYYDGILDKSDFFDSIWKLTSLGIEVTFFEFQSEKMISIEFYNISLKGIT